MGGCFSEFSKRKSIEGRKILEEARREGEVAERDAKHISEEIKAARDLELDDDIRRIFDIALEYTKNEFETFMDGVEDKKEKGKDVLAESNEISENQIDNNAQVLSYFQRMDNIRDFGKEAREKGRTEIEKSSSIFRELEKTNERAASEADTTYHRAMSNIERYLS